MSAKSSLTAIVYDGTTDPRLFKQSFDIYATSNDWTAAKRLLMLPLLLRDKAKRLFVAAKKTADDNTTLLTADQLLDKLIHLCEPQHETLLYQFYERKRLPTESISKFATALNELLVKALPDMSAANLSSLLRAQLCLHVPENMRALIQFSSTFGDTSWDDLLNVLDKTCPSSMLSTDGGNRWDAYAQNLVKHEVTMKQEPMEANWVDTRRPTNTGERFRPSQGFRSPRFEGTCDFCHFYGHRMAECNKMRRLRGEQSRGGISQQFPSSRPQFRQQFQSSGARQFQPADSFQQQQNRAQVNEASAFGWPENYQQRSELISENEMFEDSINENLDDNAEEVSRKRAEFPFFLDNCQVEILEVNLAEPSSLMRVTVTVSLFGEPKQEVLAILDTGATNSFINPRILTSAQESIIRNGRSEHVKRKDFMIRGATGIAKSNCCITTAPISIGGWSGSQLFVLSGVIQNHAMILGRDFLRNFGVMLDSSNDSMTIEGINMPINLVTSKKFDASLWPNQSGLAEAKDMVSRISAKLSEVNLLVVPANSNALELLGLKSIKSN